jgi:hypothetical protein
MMVTHDSPATTSVAEVDALQRSKSNRAVLSAAVNDHHITASIAN